LRVAIHELAEIRTGYQAREGIQPDLNGEYSLIQAKDLDEDNNHVLLVGHLEKINIKRDTTPYIVRNGDVLFLTRGRRRFATLVEHLPAAPPTIALYYFLVLRLKVDLIRPAFLVWAINESRAQDYLERASTGTAMPFVTKRSFSALEIDVPSLSRQDEIGRLYQLMSRERWLRRELDRNRSELIRATCRELYEETET
jgi:hypothetical protein